MNTLQTVYLPALAKEVTMTDAIVLLANARFALFNDTKKADRPAHIRKALKGMGTVCRAMSYLLKEDRHEVS